jgi:hypothetical protein
MFYDDLFPFQTSLTELIIIYSALKALCKKRLLEEVAIRFIKILLLFILRREGIIE